MPLTFGEKLLIEQIRCIEESGAVSNDVPTAIQHSSSGESHLSFEQRLAARAAAFSQRSDIQQQLHQAARLSRIMSLSLMAIASIAGALAVLQAIEASTTTLNIYWLIIVLLGINSLSLLLWLTSLFVWRPTATPQGIVATLWHWLEKRLAGPQTLQAAASKAWINTCHHGNAGRWWLSELTHNLWLCYLSAGCIVLLLLLMTRQFDFVWATTILSSDVFLILTDVLATPLTWLGLTTPTAEQIQLSQYGAEQQTPTDLRQVWAVFLMGSLIAYGILPRLILWLLCKLMRTRSQQRFQLNLALPYYIALRHQLTPDIGTSKIVDADDSRHTSDADTTDLTQPVDIPCDAHWVAIELSSADHWPLSPSHNDCGHITSAATLERALQQLDQDIQHQKPQRPRVVAVSINRLPDRGLTRTLQKLFAHTPTENRWLAVIVHDQADMSAERLAQWRQTARHCEIPNSQISLIQEHAP